MKNENLKDNIVDAPTLFVGVGGTGCRIVKRVAELCQPGEVENISFVCLDTNVNDLSTVENLHHPDRGRLSRLRSGRPAQLVPQERGHV